jgi:SAM-dependent methyltransferase
MHWRVKGVVQKALGVIPGGRALHHRLQRGFGGLRRFDRELAGKVDDWTIMARHLRDAGIPIAGTRFFELGTGWYPTFPLACVLAGATRVETFDLTRHLRPELVRACMAGLHAHLGAIAAASGASAVDVAARHASIAEAMARGADLAGASDGGIRYHAPADATRSGLPDATADVVFSNSVLEHVAPEAIPPLFREAIRVLRAGGVMFHSVNCGDHYAYVDPALNQLHYLRYSDRGWRFWNNEFLYQNRLRAHAFPDAARDAGFAIELDTSKARPERLRQLAAMRVHPQFADIPPERLCITTVDFLARKPG